MGKENVSKGRRDLSFNLENDTQNTAYIFLGMIGRQQSDFISKLIVKYLSDCGVTDLSSLSVADAKDLCRTVSVGRPNPELSNSLIYGLLSVMMQKKSTVDFLQNSTFAGTVGSNTISKDINPVVDVEEEYKSDVTQNSSYNKAVTNTQDEIEDNFTGDDIEDDIYETDDNYLPDMAVIDSLSAFMRN